MQSPFNSHSHHFAGSLQNDTELYNSIFDSDDLLHQGQESTSFATHREDAADYCLDTGPHA